MEKIKIAIASYGILIISILGLIVGCLAKSKDKGSLYLLICGIIAIICNVLIIIELNIDWMMLVPAIAFTIGGLLGMKNA